MDGMGHRHGGRGGYGDGADPGEVAPAGNDVVENCVLSLEPSQCDGEWIACPRVGRVRVILSVGLGVAPTRDWNKGVRGKPVVLADAGDEDGLAQGGLGIDVVGQMVCMFHIVPRVDAPAGVPGLAVLYQQGVNGTGFDHRLDGLGGEPVNDEFAEDGFAVEVDRVGVCRPATGG